MGEQKDTTQEFEEALKWLSQEKYVLRLFVAGMNPKSLQSIENIKRICETYLAGRYQLEVIDVYQQPILAKDGQIVAAPTLVKELPPPLRKLVGSMSDTERVLVGMDLHIVMAGTVDHPAETKTQKQKDDGAVL
ncbi:MAG: thiol-disulfide isomerase [Methanothrix sp.]|nr:MAG: thiol-disulfide isomerase [Methanothrix sp.]